MRVSPAPKLQEMPMSSFKALVATKGETGTNLAFTDFAEAI